MKHNDLNDPLWRDTLDTAHDAAFSQASLDLMLNASRHQQQFRRMRRKVVTVTVLVLMAVCAIGYLQTTNLRYVSNEKPVSNTPKVRLLTNEELLARFPDQPVALIGTGDNQQLLLFHEP